MKKTRQGPLARPTLARGRDTEASGLSLHFPALASGQAAVSPDTLSGHALFAPTLFLHSLPSCGEEGAKVKRKHPGRISRNSLPERGRGRPRSGVARRRWGPELRRNWVGAVPGGRPGAARSCPEPLVPLGKANADVNIPTPQGTFGPDLELKFQTEWDRA
ncbi:PREDICTED: uncharacterized protein LOC105509752 [Colobus angolensis palliatus]|uniref:uncharacterized protein LOC105509752 n=1 Tax=Colobus angolensis palliatus TaxID=336983 RepID=UPI0005F4775B|nr:PREDICTED: uncharacterized protein LOC105509752 [Colobus angolensis palliatus]